MESLRGVKIEDPRGAHITREILHSLNDTGYRPTVRFTPARWASLRECDLKVRQFYTKAHVLYQFAESNDLSDFSLAQWLERVKNSVALLRGYVKIYDCGSGINLTKTKEATWSKVVKAIDHCKLHGEKTAITLSLGDEQQLYEWVQNFPLSPTYVFLSAYPNFTPGREYDWQKIFQRLGELYPSAFLGIGEFGTDPIKATMKQKMEMVRRFYSIEVSHDRFVGGGFYGHFVRDCVRGNDKSVLNVIREVWGQQNTERKASNE